MMIIALLICNLIMFMMFSDITGTSDLILGIFFLLATGAIIKDMIDTQKRIPKGFGAIGIILIILGFLFLITGGDFENFMMSMAFLTGGVWIAFFALAKKKPEERNVIKKHSKSVPQRAKVLKRTEKNVPNTRVILEKPEPEIQKKSIDAPGMIPEIPADKVKLRNLKIQTSEPGLSGLLQRVMSLSSVRGNQVFFDMLNKTQCLYRDLQEKGVQISELLTEQMEKLLLEYLDLDDDPVQTEKTIELKRKIQDAFGPISQVLEKLYDQYITSRQYDIETDIESFEMKLRMDGLLDSDFSMNRE